MQNVVSNLAYTMKTFRAKQKYMLKRLHEVRPKFDGGGSAAQTNSFPFFFFLILRLQGEPLQNSCMQLSTSNIPNHNTLSFNFLLE
jgi:hypothetical protein